MRVKRFREECAGKYRELLEIDLFLVPVNAKRDAQEVCTTIWLAADGRNAA
jgi:hypothetical protein